MSYIKGIFAVVLLSLLAAACSTMPAEIEDKYLAEKTESQSKVINDLEQKIIDKYKQKELIEKKSAEQAKLPGKTEEEINLLKKEISLLKEEVYFFEKNKDAVNLELKKTRLAEDESKLTIKTSLLNYQMSEKKLNETDLDLKNAELALLISEMRFKKAEIASQYRDRNEPPKPDNEQNFFTKLFNKNDPNDKYGYKIYGEYMDQKKEGKVKAEVAYREAEVKFLEAKKSMDSTK